MLGSRTRWLDMDTEQGQGRPMWCAVGLTVCIVDSIVIVNISVSVAGVGKGSLYRPVRR